VISHRIIATWVEISILKIENGDFRSTLHCLISVSYHLELRIVTMELKGKHNSEWKPTLIRQNSVVSEGVDQ
jgi:hypothetical protein